MVLKQLLNLARGEEGLRFSLVTLEKDRDNLKKKLDDLKEVEEDQARLSELAQSAAEGGKVLTARNGQMEEEK